MWSITTHTGHKFVHPQSDAYYTYYTLIESQHINSNSDKKNFNYEQKYIYDAIWNIISVTINI